MQGKWGKEARQGPAAPDTEVNLHPVSGRHVLGQG